MSIQLDARIVSTERLTDVVARAERYLSLVPHEPFVIEASRASEILVGPFPVRDVAGVLDQTRTYKEAYSSWDRGYVPISTGSIARIGLKVGYRGRLDEIELGSYQPTEADRRESEAASGYSVQVDVGFLRTKASFALASLVVCAVAAHHQSRVLDDGNWHLKLGRLVEPGTLAEIFARHTSASNFEEFADQFCREIGFAPNWPGALLDDQLRG